MSVLLGVDDVVTAAIAMIDLRDRGISKDDIVVLVADLGHGSEIRTDPTTVPEMASLLSGCKRIESLNALIWPQIPQGWRPSDMAIDGLGRLLVELEGTISEVIVPDDKPIWASLARAVEPARTTWVCSRPEGHRNEDHGLRSPSGSQFVHLDTGSGLVEGDHFRSVPSEDVIGLLERLRSARDATSVAIWLPDIATLDDLEPAKLAPPVEAATHDGRAVMTYVRDLPPLPDAWFDSVAGGVELGLAQVVSADSGPEVTLLRHPVDTLITADPVLGGRARMLGVQRVHVVGGSHELHAYDRMDHEEGRTDDRTEGPDAVRSHKPPTQTPPQERGLNLGSSALGAVAVGLTLMCGAGLVLAVDVFGGSGAALAIAVLLLGGLSAAFAAVVVRDGRRQQREIRSSVREVRATVREVREGVRAIDAQLTGLRTDLLELRIREHQEEFRDRLAALEQASLVMSAMQQRTVVAVEDVGRIAAVITAREDAASTRSDAR